MLCPPRYPWWYMMEKTGFLGGIFLRREKSVYLNPSQKIYEISKTCIKKMCFR